MATATQGKTKDPPIQTLQHPLGLSHVLQYLPHLSPKVSFITHEFPAPPHLQLSRFLLERGGKKSPVRAYFTTQARISLPGWDCISAAHGSRLAGGKELRAGRLYIPPHTKQIQSWTKPMFTTHACARVAPKHESKARTCLPESWPPCSSVSRRQSQQTLNLPGSFYTWIWSSNMALVRDWISLWLFLEVPISASSQWPSPLCKPSCSHWQTRDRVFPPVHGHWLAQRALEKDCVMHPGDIPGEASPTPRKIAIFPFPGQRVLKYLPLGEAFKNQDFLSYSFTQGDQGQKIPHIPILLLQRLKSCRFPAQPIWRPQGMTDGWGHANYPDPVTEHKERLPLASLSKVLI